MIRMAFHRRYYNRCNILTPTTSIPIVNSINSIAMANQIILNQKAASTARTSDRDLYKILGVNRTASQQEIKKAFYTASKKYHPDVVGSNVASANKFLEVKEAYDILKDEQKRREYDRQRDAAQHTKSAFQQHYTRRNNHQRTRTMDQEMDPEFYRIWRTMQQDPEFQQAARQFREAQRRMQQEAWERQQQRRGGMFTNNGNGNDPNWEEVKMQMKKGRELFLRMIIIYAFAFLLVAIFVGMIGQNGGGGTRITRRDLHDKDRRRIEEMMKKMP